jgi:hypothetical protein
VTNVFSFLCCDEGLCGRSYPVTFSSDWNPNKMEYIEKIIKTKLHKDICERREIHGSS